MKCTECKQEKPALEWMMPCYTASVGGKTVKSAFAYVQPRFCLECLRQWYAKEMKTRLTVMIACGVAFLLAAALRIATGVTFWTYPMMLSLGAGLFAIDQWGKGFASLQKTSLEELLPTMIGLYYGKMRRIPAEDLVWIEEIRMPKNAQGTYSRDYELPKGVTWKTQGQMEAAIGRYAEQQSISGDERAYFDYCMKANPPLGGQGAQRIPLQGHSL